MGILAVIIVVVLGYASTVYHNVNSAAEAIYTPIVTENYRDTETPVVSDETQDYAESAESMASTATADSPELVERGASISILLLGIDTGDLGRIEQGRSDSMIVAIINPNTAKATLLSIPRDTYAPIVGHGTLDKINHAYAFGGTAMSVNSVQSLLDIPIDYYVAVNMAGIKEIVDAVGGVDVYSPLTFNQNNFDFIEGMNHLDGGAALAFSRMRYEDPEGDTGRQGRQRLIIEAILKKIATPETLLNYQNILNSLSSNVQTNFQMSDYFLLQSNDYLAVANNIQQEQLGGAGGMLDGIYYNFVDDTELARVQSLLQTELELK